MLPQSEVRKKKNSSKVNLIISVVFHTLLIGGAFYFAAREGLLGEKIRTLTVTTVKDEKPPEKKEEKKEEPPKVVEIPKATPANLPKEIPRAASASVTAPPTVAPPAADLPTFEFEGGKTVQTSSDLVQLYKGLIEYALRSKWNRPTDMADDNFVAEVEVAVNRDGAISQPAWKSGSGDKRWDDSVKQAIAATTALNRPPPTNFPPRVTVRFDVLSEQTEPVMP